MKQRSLKIEPVAYTGLFNACAQSPWPTTDGLQRATNLRIELKRKGYPFNQTISHAMIKGVLCLSVFVKCLLAFLGISCDFHVCKDCFEITLFSLLLPF